MKIADKIRWRKKRQRKQQDQPNNLLFYSFEFFPPKTEAGILNLLTRIDRMARLDPLFIDVTWSKASGSNALRIASHAQKYDVDVLLHLTCQGMSREDIVEVLEQAKTAGVHNILALRGDPPRGKKAWEVDDVSGGYCDRAIDLVKLIRELHGDYFGVCVAGHPEGHPSSHSMEQEVQHLREKINAGADAIITQFFYDVDAFRNFVEQCRAIGIDVPIIPGIMPLQSYQVFHKMTQYCQTKVPLSIWDRLDPIKGDDQQVKNIGCDIAVDICQQILNIDTIDGIHFYTLNLERSVIDILVKLRAVDLISQSDHGQSIRAHNRDLPWQPSNLETRSQRESVRPINWANRPKSYVLRTETWDEFPNGRWGDSASPAFGELSDVGHFYSFSLGSEEEQRALLGISPTEETHVFETFAKYIEGLIPYLPWCETALQPESFTIQSKLSQLNRNGYLTINSQPAVNGIPSTDKLFGWGGSGGYIYQKAYCECFCSPSHLEKLRHLVEEHAHLNIYAVNDMGEELREGVLPGGVTALTWGVFPNREVVQPTIFDPATYRVWAEEAFSLWTTLWSNLYDLDSPSFDLIESIRDQYYLVAIIDNDYISGSSDHTNTDIWSLLLSL